MRRGGGPRCQRTVRVMGDPSTTTPSTPQTCRPTPTTSPACRGRSPSRRLRRRRAPGGAHGGGGRLPGEGPRAHLTPRPHPPPPHRPPRRAEGRSATPTLDGPRAPYARRVLPASSVSPCSLVRPLRRGPKPSRPPVTEQSGFGRSTRRPTRRRSGAPGRRSPSRPAGRRDSRSLRDVSVAETGMRWMPSKAPVAPIRSTRSQARATPASRSVSMAATTSRGRRRELGMSWLSLGAMAAPLAMTMTPA